MALSYSQLSSYRRCPKQYEYASVKKVSRRINARESFGSSIHHTLRRWGALELRQTAHPSVQRQLTLFTEEQALSPKAEPLALTTLLTFWRECFIAEGYASRAERDACILRGDVLLTQFFDWWQACPSEARRRRRAKPRMIVTIESGFKLALPTQDGTRPPVIISGRFDRIERTESGLLIIDYKTSEPKSQAEVDNDLQLSIYALAAADQFKEPIAGLTLLFLGEDGLTERCTKRNASQLRDAITIIRHLQEGIQSGDFHPTPGVNVCGYCPYREICPARAV